MITNKNKLHLLLSMFVLGNSFPQNTYSKIKIVSDNEFTRTALESNIGSVSAANPNLTYNSLKSSYYNPCYLDVKNVTSFSTEGVTIDIGLNKISPRCDWGSYEFKMPIMNLNSITDYYYYSTANPKKKQSVYDIYWGFTINFGHNGTTESMLVFFNKAKKKSEFGSGIYTLYNINNTEWKERYGYPDADLSFSTELKISTLTPPSTYIEWDDIVLAELPYMIDAIYSIQVHVGCQADVKFGKASIDLGSYASQGYLDEHYTKLSELAKAEKYFSAKEAAKQNFSKDGCTTEFNAYSLAFCQLRCNEYTDCIETSNALVEYKGDYLKDSFLFRGIAKECLGDFQGALSDYNSAGEKGLELYKELTLKIEKTNNSQQKSSSVKSSQKPQLKK